MRSCPLLLTIRLDLEVEGTSNLQEARGVITVGRGAEAAVLGIAVQPVKVHAVKQVEGIESQIKVEPLKDLGVLVKAEIRLRETRVAELVGDSLISELTECRNGEEGTA